MLPYPELCSFPYSIFPFHFHPTRSGCKEIMFKVIDKGAGFNHAGEFIDESCDRLVGQLIYESQ